MKKYLEAGKIRNTHGVKGAVKVEHWCDTPQIFASLPAVYTAFGEIYKEHKIVSASIAGDGTLIVRLEDANTFEEAAKLKNVVLYADREDLPQRPDRIYIADVIGMAVIDAVTGEKYGTVADVTTTGVQELYVVSTPNGEKLIPAVNAFIDHVDFAEGVFIKPIPGLLD